MPDRRSLTLLRVVRAHPSADASALARLLGQPRTNFGRRLAVRRLEAQLTELRQEGLLTEVEGGYRLSENGRRLLGELALEGRLD
jgi:hypothetical protein